MNFKPSDAGQSQCGGPYARERGCCTVRCLAHVLSMPYPEAHAKLRLLGRKNGRGFHFRVAANYYGFKRVAPDSVASSDEWASSLQRKLPLRDWPPRLQKGRFAVHVRGHIFAVIDGKVLDGAKPTPRKKVLDVWENTQLTNT